MWAGTRLIRENVSFLSTSPLKEYGEQLEKYDKLDNTNYIYSGEGEIISFDEIENNQKTFSI